MKASVAAFFATIYAMMASGSVAFAQYVKFDGDAMRSLIVGHTVYIDRSPTIFQKDGHLISPYSHKVIGGYTIAPDGKICFDGLTHFSIQYSRGGGMGSIGSCFRIVRSQRQYLGVDPDSYVEWVFVEIR